MMKKIMNNPNTIVEDTLKGFVSAHSDIISLVPGTHIVERKTPKDKGRVRVMMANGAGHEPAVSCWVGEGMFDMNVVGEIFTCPSSSHIYEGIKRLSENGPVLVAIQNHAGDVINAGLAINKAIDEGLEVQSVLFYDDIASAPKDFIEERRGIGGMIFYSKIIGAMAEQGDDINSLIKMFREVRDNTRTFAFAVTNCTNPITGLSIFNDLPNDMIEMGMGVHGEGGGADRIKIPTAKELAKLLSDKLIEDGGYRAGDKLLVFVNGSGGMTSMELSMIYGGIHDYLEIQSLKVVGCKVGNYLTTQELSGASVSFCRVDDQMLALWNTQCNVSHF